MIFANILIRFSIRTANLKFQDFQRCIDCRPPLKSQPLILSFELTEYESGMYSMSGSSATIYSHRHCTEDHFNDISSARKRRQQPQSQSSRSLPSTQKQYTGPNAFNSADDTWFEREAKMVTVGRHETFPNTADTKSNSRIQSQSCHERVLRPLCNSCNGWWRRSQHWFLVWW